MNGIGRKSLLAGCLAACAVAGCSKSYSDIVDPCWPQRYSCMAREEVNTPFGVQANNGLVLDQTLWNYHFADGKAELNTMGREHLERLARRRPGPVPEVFVQASHDTIYDAKKSADQYMADRTKLDGERVKAVNDYLAAIRPEVPFKVAVHDPSPVGMNGVEADIAAQGHLHGAVGTINAGVSAQRTADRAQGQQTQSQNQTIDQTVKQR